MQMVRFYELAPDLPPATATPLGPCFAAHHPEDAVGAILHLCHLRASRQHPDLGWEDGRGCRRQHHRAAAAGDGHDAAGLSRRSTAASEAGLSASGKSTSSLGSVILTGDPTTCQPLQAGTLAAHRATSSSIATGIPVLPTRPYSRLWETFASIGATRRFPTMSSPRTRRRTLRSPTICRRTRSPRHRGWPTNSSTFNTFRTTRSPIRTFRTARPIRHNRHTQRQSGAVELLSGEHRLRDQSFPSTVCRWPVARRRWSSHAMERRRLAAQEHLLRRPLYNMGGLGCHGSQGRNPWAGRDFSVIVRARGPHAQPQTPAMATSQGLSTVRRNKTLR